MKEKCQSGSGNVGGVAPTPEPHNSVCFRFFPDVGSIEPPRIKRVRPPGARRVGLADLPCGGGASQIHRKVGGMASAPKPHQSITDTPLVFSDYYTLAQAAGSSAEHKLCRGG